MAITPEIEKWLKDSGYENHCFISWPHINNREVTDCAEYLKNHIQEHLGTEIHEPQVFLDKEARGGADWENRIAQAICRSVSLVAVCLPMYYHPAHITCGLEWAGMDMLYRRRFPDTAAYTIIPVVVKTHPLPEPVSRIGWHIDFSKVMTTGRRYFNTEEYRRGIETIAEHIATIAVTLAQSNAPADCQQYQLPRESPFLNYEAPKQPPPLRS